MTDKSQTIEVGDLCIDTRIDNPLWKYVEVRAIDGDQAFVAMFRGHDTVPISALKLKKKKGAPNAD